jgi:hypothetical protein
MKAKHEKYSEFIFNTCLTVQDGDVSTPSNLIAEKTLRARLVKEFGVTKGWAYEKIREFVKRYPELQLQKIKNPANGKDVLCLAWIEK